MTSTCAGYDDDAQICCGHGGGEVGQSVSLTAEVHEATMTSGGDGPGRCCFRFFHLLLCILSSSHLTPRHQLVFFIFSVRGSLMKAGGGWREPPAVACSSRNAA